MSVVLLSACVAVFEIISFYLIGRMIPVRTPDGGRSAAETVCAGFIVESAAMEILVFFMKWGGASLTAFLFLWAGILSVMLAIPVFMFSRRAWEAGEMRGGTPRLLLPELVVFITAVASSVYAAIFPAVGSGAVTIERIVSDISSDTLGLYSASGVRLTAIPSAELLTGFYARGTFLSMLTGLSPDAVCNYVGVIITVFLAVLAIYRALVRLLSGQRRKAAVLVIIYIGLNLFIRIPGAEKYMIFESGFSGYAVAVNVLIPILFITAHAISLFPDDTAPYVLLFLFGISAPSWCTASIFAAPFAMALFVIAAALKARRAVPLAHLFLSMIIPSAALLLAAAVPMITVS